MRFLLASLGSLLLSQTASAGPTCALLDPEKLPQAALLEAKLLADGSVTWVERASIDKILKEQKLQAMFSPQGVGERVKLGQLLKADLLVMVRPVKNVPEPAIEVIVSETAGGLRLAIRAVPLTKNPNDDVTGLLAAVKDGVAKYGETVKDVVAVPPFVSQDLGYQFEHLKAAYAKLAESMALDRKGIVVVELEEANAVLRELKLAAPGSALRERPLPVFLLGEYRHDGKGKDRTVNVKLRAERGGKLIGKPEAAILKPDEVPDTIRKWAASVLDAAGAAAPPASDAKAEAKRLAELSRIHKRLGNWPEALALIDASLLLDANQPELHADAIEILPRWIQDIVSPNRDDPERVRRGAEAHRRGLEHLEALVTSGAKLPRYVPRPGPSVPQRQFASSATRPGGGPMPPAIAEIVQPLRDEERALYAKLVLIVAKQGNLDEEVYYAQRAAWYSETSAEGYARLEKTLLSLLELPGTRARMRVHLLSPQNLPRGGTMFAEHRAMLDRLQGVDNADLKAVVAEVRKITTDIERATNEQAERFRKEQTWRAAFEAAKKTDPTLGKPLSATDPERLEAALAGSPFKLIRLVVEKGDPDLRLSPEHFFPRIAQIRGILAAGPGVDVLWADGEFSDGTLYLMKEKGKLRQCYRIGGIRAKFTSVVFDGKYVWASGERPGVPPVLVALDPATERVVTVTEKDGLPVGVRGPGSTVSDTPYHLAALDPGRVCVAGSFKQAWVAVATFEPAKGVTVKVVHEARDAEEDRPDEWKKTTVAFIPWGMFTLRGDPADGKAATRVMITRLGRSQGVLRHPLLVDPDTGTAEVMQDALPPLSIYSSCGTGRSVYVASGMGYKALKPEPLRLLRVDYPGVLRDLGPGLDAGNRPALHFDGERLHIVRVSRELHPWEEFVPVKERWWPQGDPSDWWTADPDRKDLRKVASDFKRVYAVGTSSHYGLVALLNLRSETALCSVMLEPLAKP